MRSRSSLTGIFGMKPFNLLFEVGQPFFDPFKGCTVVLIRYSAFQNFLLVLLVDNPVLPDFILVEFSGIPILLNLFIRPGEHLFNIHSILGQGATQQHTLVGEENDDS